MAWRAIFAFVLTLMIAASIGMAIAAVERSPVYLHEPASRTIVLEPVLTLIVYAGVITIVVANRGVEWDVELRNAALFGSVAGLCEVLNLLIENGLLFPVRGPALQIAGMLLIFALWAAAGARAARVLGRFRPGVVAAVMSAGVCMVITVTVGFATELFIAPPHPDYVATWAEFKRSGWTDPNAFGIANTLASGFTHLIMGPVIAFLVGSFGSWLGLRAAKAGEKMQPEG
jgi:hypothetical protein